MNLNKKYDFYKYSLYYLISNAVVFLIGILVASIFGFNYASTQTAGKIFFESSLSVVISLALVLIYVGLRYGFAKALSIVLVCAHNVLLSVALVAIVRVPVGDAMVMGFALLVGLTAIVTLVLTEKHKDVNFKKADYNELIKTTFNENVKNFAIFFGVLVAILLLCLIIGSANIFNLARVLFVMLIVLAYSTFTINLPVWLYFSSKIKRVKRAKVDENVENQKVVKAVADSNGDDTDLLNDEVAE